MADVLKTLGCSAFDVGDVYNILDDQVGEETGEWLDTFALVTECTDAKFCNTTNQVQ